MARDLDDELRAEMAAWEAAGLRRELRGLENVADFVTNDYLGLARHPEVAAGAREAIERFGCGARASRLLGGGSDLDEKLEAAVAEWLDAEAALLFPSGFQANLGLVPALVTRGDVVLSDALNHASLIDAARLSRAAVRVFAHGDLEHLERLLAGARTARRRLVLTESVFSMDGDLAPLPELATLCERHDALLVVDEAHAVGVVGPAGAGGWARARALGVPASVLTARVVTGGKALGVMGAFVVGSRTLREHLVNRSRAFVFSTGVSPAVTGALARSVAFARDAREERERAREHARRLADAWKLPAPGAAIVPLVIGDERATVELAGELRARGLETRAVRPPTVPPGTARLRIACHATNTREEVGLLLDALAPHAPVKHGTRPIEIATHARPVVVVAGTDTGVGKTVVSALLARAAAGRGPATYWKPVQTGDDDDTTEVRRLCADRGLTLAEPTFRFPLPASPHEAARAAGSAVSVAALDAAMGEHLDAGPGAGPLIVELAGGLLVPLTDDFTQADWLERWRPRVVLAARSGLGTLNHSLLSCEALDRRGVPLGALFLVGEPHPSNRATLAARTRLAHLFEVPLLATDGHAPSPAALDGWLAEHDLAPLFRDAGVQA